MHRTLENNELEPAIAAICIEADWQIEDYSDETNGDTIEDGVNKPYWVYDNTFAVLGTGETPTEAVTKAVSYKQLLSETQPSGSSAWLKPGVSAAEVLL